MIEEAASILLSANIFILAGTSLQVYPAAGLIDYLPRGIPKYIIDNNPPYVPPHHNFTIIKDTATRGMEEVKKRLEQEK
jgi:NAD-dependent deacetylase